MLILWEVGGTLAASAGGRPTVSSSDLHLASETAGRPPCPLEALCGWGNITAMKQASHTSCSAPTAQRPSAAIVMKQTFFQAA